MVQTTVDYQASRRWTEIWSPVPFTNNLQIWASLSAFGLAIFALFYNYLWKWMAMSGVALPNVYAVSPETASSLLGSSVLGYIMLGVIALAGFLMFVFCFGSLVFLIFRALRHQKEVVESTDISEHIKAGMTKNELAEIERLNGESITLGTSSLDSLAKQIVTLKKARVMIDDFLRKVEDKPESKPNGKEEKRE